MFPHSLGLFYTGITQFLGFKNYGDEYKVMGLAPYGDPVYYEKMRKILIKSPGEKFKLNLDYFLHHTGNVDMTWLESTPKISNVFDKNLINLLGNERKEKDKIEKFHMDIASSAQKLYETIIIEIANEVFNKQKSDNLCLSGGCAMNSVANGKIIKNTGYKNIYIPSSPGDSGGAIGSAVKVIRETNILNKYNDNPYLGPEYTNMEIKKIIYLKEKELIDRNIKVVYFNSKEEQLIKLAELISNGNVIGFFNGRMEWGPRALGNRSILADPRNKNIKEILNSKIKRRESFRPFAPSILREKVGEWFEENRDVPFMSQVLQISKNKRDLIPSVTHVDGSGRLQTVTKESNLNFYNLISEFYKITGVPILLNTSFNENEPIVCNPEEALDCFIRTNMDCLSLENYLLTRDN